VKCPFPAGKSSRRSEKRRRGFVFIPANIIFILYQTAGNFARVGLSYPRFLLSLTISILESITTYRGMWEK